MKIKKNLIGDLMFICWMSAIVSLCGLIWLQNTEVGETQNQQAFRYAALISLGAYAVGSFAQHYMGDDA